MARTRIVVPTKEQEAELARLAAERAAKAARIAEEHEAKQAKLAADLAAEKAKWASLPPHPMMPTSPTPRRVPGSREPGDRYI